MKERFGAENPKSMMLRFHTQTGGVTLTAQQPINNIVRVALQGFAATCRRHAVAAHQRLRRGARAADRARRQDRAAHPADPRQRVRRRRHRRPVRGLLLRRGADRRDRVGRRSELIGKIDEMGGSVEAIEFIMKEIDESAWGYQERYRQRAGHRRRRQQVRRGRHRGPRDPARRPAVRARPGRAAEGVQGRAATRSSSQRRLDEIRETARGTDNLLPVLHDALRDRCSIGEVCGAMKDVFGAYQQPASLLGRQESASRAARRSSAAMAEAHTNPREVPARAVGGGLGPRIPGAPPRRVRRDPHHPAEPETTVAWEGDRARGTVDLAPAGWGTKVTVTAEEVEGVAVAPPAEEPEPDAVSPRPAGGRTEPGSSASSCSKRRRARAEPSSRSAGARARTRAAAGAGARDGPRHRGGARGDARQASAPPTTAPSAAASYRCRATTGLQVGVRDPACRPWATIDRPDGDRRACACRAAPCLPRFGELHGRCPCRLRAGSSGLATAASSLHRDCRALALRALASPRCLPALRVAFGAGAEPRRPAVPGWVARRCRRPRPCSTAAQALQAASRPACRPPSGHGAASGGGTLID